MNDPLVTVSDFRRERLAVPTGVEPASVASGIAVEGADDLVALMEARSA